MSNIFIEKVTSVHHWNDALFSFKTTRDPAFRFDSGQFTMLGLKVDGRPLLRAYSMASAVYDDQLEFLSIKVANGPLTSKLQHLRVDDDIMIGRKPAGTLIQSSLLPGRNLYLLGTGTGLAPFMSIVRDPATYMAHRRIILVHGCRTISELAYGDFLRDELPRHELLGEIIAAQLIYHPTVTRDAFKNKGRITELFVSNDWFSAMKLAPLDPDDDRVMLCGSPALLADMKTLLESRGFAEGTNATPASYVIERAFVEK